MKLTIENFIGTWELIKWTAKLKDGKIVFPFGDDAVGRISYDRAGNMGVQIMKKNRSQFLSDDPLQAQQDEAVKAFNGFLSYCGNYEVNFNNNQVIHQVKISSFPNWTGQNQIRYFEFNNDNLILSTDPIVSTKHRLVWRKIEK